VYGQAVIFTATVTGGSGTATGTITWSNATTTTSFFTNTLSAGVAKYTNCVLDVGVSTIVATYSGDGTYSGSAASTNQTVNLADTVTTLSSSTNPSVWGQNIVFTARVTNTVASCEIPTSTVSLYDGVTSLGFQSVDGSGVATFNLSSLGVGVHTNMTAVYNAGDNFNTSTSAVLTQTVNQASSAMTAGSSANPSVNGQSVTFTAHVNPVSPGAGTPSGTVTYSEGSVLLGTGTLSSGQATFTTSGLAPGAHTIVMRYLGDTEFIVSSLAMTQTVNRATSTTSLVSSTNPAVLGTSVTFTSTVSAVAPGSGTPDGTIEFKDGAIFMAIADLSGGVATWTTTNLAVGVHPMTAVYSGDGGFFGSTSSTLNETIHRTTNSVTSTTVITASANPSVFGQAVVFTNTVSGSAGTPTGTVTNSVDGLSVKTNTLASGKANYTNATLAVGVHTIAGDYSGDASYDQGSGSLSQTVNKGSVTNVVTSTLNPSVLWDSITLTATVTAVAPAAGTPSGTITFKDGTTTLGISNLVAGVASWTGTNLLATSHSITAVYSGDGNFLAGTAGTNTQVVEQPGNFIYVPYASSEHHTGLEAWSPFYGEGWTVGMPAVATDWPSWQGWRAFDTNFHAADKRLLALEAATTVRRSNTNLVTIDWTGTSGAATTLLTDGSLTIAAGSLSVGDVIECRASGWFDGFDTGDYLNFGWSINGSGILGVEGTVAGSLPNNTQWEFLGRITVIATGAGGQVAFFFRARIGAQSGDPTFDPSASSAWNTMYVDTTADLHLDFRGAMDDSGGDPDPTVVCEQAIIQKL
jgi:hypothetical protein